MMADCAAFLSTVAVLVLVDGVHLPPPHLSLSSDLLTQDPQAVFHHRLRPNPANALAIHSNSNSIIPASVKPSLPHFTQDKPKITSFTLHDKPFPPNNKPFLPPNAHNKQFLHPNKPFPPFNPNGKPKTSPFHLHGRPGLPLSPHSQPPAHFNRPAGPFNGLAGPFKGPANFNGPAGPFNGLAGPFNGPANFNGPAGSFNGPAGLFNGPAAHFNGPANFNGPAAHFKNPAGQFANLAAQFANLAANAGASRIPSQLTLSDLGKFRDPHPEASAFFPKQGLNIVDKVDVDAEEPGTSPNFFPADGYDLDSYFNDFPVFGYFDFEPSKDGEKLPLSP